MVNILLIVFSILVLCYLVFELKQNENIIESFLDPCRGGSIGQGMEITNWDKFNRKNIWESVKKKYGRDAADQIFPRTYVFPEDLEDIKNDEHKHFILKTLWSGGRSGVDLYNDKESIERDHKKYCVGQVYIEDPFLVKGYKFNTRFFIVVDCNIGIFLYRNGYNTYTSKKFDYDSMDRETKINKYRPPAEFYLANDVPLLFSDFCLKYKVNENKVIQQLAEKVKIIVNSNPDFCDLSKDKNKFNIYGIDSELLSNSDIRIIEINGNPEICYHWELLNQLRSKMLDGCSKKNYMNNSNFIPLKIFN